MSRTSTREAVRLDGSKLPADRFLTTHQIAAYLQVDPSTVGKWIDAGVLVGYRTPGGHRRAQVAAVREMAKKFGVYLPTELREG